MKPPANSERLHPAALARRCLTDRATAGRWIASGRIRPVLAAHDGLYFASADLDRLRAVAIEDIRLRCSRLSADERTRLAAFFAELNAHAEGNDVPTEADRKAGAALADRHLKLNATLDRLIELNGAVGAAIGQVSQQNRSQAVAIASGRMTFAASTVDSGTGLIRGVTVGKAGVDAIGKTVFLDKSGNVVPPTAPGSRRYQIRTDASTLDTLLGAFQDAGGRLKVREDHSDEVGARAGFIDNLRRVTDSSGDRVVGDVHLFSAYRNRDIVLETAQTTPELIGLSIDFLPSYSISGDVALMRVQQIAAVDIVDAGAITPDGLK